MMLKKGDFAEIEYTGYDENGDAFDSTSGEIAKQLHGREGAMLIVFGKYELIKGLESALEELKEGEQKEYTFGPDLAFGHKKKESVKVVSLAEFHRNEISPYPGLKVHFDTDRGRIFGTVKSVNSGRIVVDFNHPLADRRVKYTVKLVRVITDAVEKAKALLKDGALEGEAVSLKDGKLDVSLKKSPEDKEYDYKKAKFTVMAKAFIPDIKDIAVKE